ncbi:MAG: nucleoside triphosphate pyrophosphohydrolase family protein [Candidatus Levybacteria bacterium]|nr:nucleoside triphosphate pyrophosphohydrolase family protein [Candidatus Levybacteria bacterium]
MTNFEKVEQFMRTFGQKVNTTPDFPANTIVELRDKLICEEKKEFDRAVFDRSIVDIADALTDLLYVIYGAGHAYGINLDACFAEVHRSNMSKLGTNDEPIYREDGKVLKGPGFFLPDFAKVLYGSK